MMVLFFSLMLGSFMITFKGVSSESTTKKTACIIMLWAQLFITLIFAVRGHNDLDYHKKRVEELMQKKKEKIEQLKQEVQR